MLPKAAKVTRGVMVRGKAHGEGAVLPIIDRPTSQDQISPQEYMELKHTNFVVAAPEVAPTPVTATPLPASAMAGVTGKAPDKK